jgi:hypothetical protein
VRAGRDDATAGQHERSRRSFDQLRGGGDRPRARPPGSGSLDPRMPAARRGSLSHVDWDLDQHGPRPPARRERERLVEQRAQVLAVLNRARVLHDRDRHTRDIGLLKGHRPCEMGRDLTADEHDRNRVHPRVRDRGQQVDGARTGCRERHAGPARHPRPALCGVSRRGLMAGQDVTDRARGEGVVQRQHGTARNAEDRLDPVAFQRCDQGIGTAHPLLLPYW